MAIVQGTQSQTLALATSATFFPLQGLLDAQLHEKMLQKVSLTSPFSSSCCYLGGIFFPLLPFQLNNYFENVMLFSAVNLSFGTVPLLKASWQTVRLFSVSYTAFKVKMGPFIHVCISGIMVCRNNSFQEWNFCYRFQRNIWQDRPMN